MRFQQSEGIPARHASMLARVPREQHSSVEFLCQRKYPNHIPDADHGGFIHPDNLSPQLVMHLVVSEQVFQRLRLGEALFSLSPPGSIRRRRARPDLAPALRFYLG
jgi:hypothetical protein